VGKAYLDGDKGVCRRAAAEPSGGPARAPATVRSQTCRTPDAFKHVLDGDAAALDGARAPRCGERSAPAAELRGLKIAGRRRRSRAGPFKHA